jgi:hypothetical protein
VGSPSLAPGVGGKSPGIGVAVDGGSCFLDVGGLVGVLGWLNSSESGLVMLLVSVPCVGGVKVSPRGVLCLGLWVPRFGIPLMACLCFSLSSVALRRASKASSSDVCDETARFLGGRQPSESPNQTAWHTSARQRRPNPQGCCRS